MRTYRQAMIWSYKWAPHTRIDYILWDEPTFHSNITKGLKLDPNIDHILSASLVYISFMTIRTHFVNKEPLDLCLILNSVLIQVTLNLYVVVDHPMVFMREILWIKICTRLLHWYDTVIAWWLEYVIQWNATH